MENDKMASAHKTVTLEELTTIIRGRPGLIVGPGLTLGAGSTATIAKTVASSFSIEPDSQLTSVVDRLILSGTPSDDIRKRVRESIEAIKPSNQLATAADSRWSGVLSACLDTRFEDAFRHWCDVSPTRRDVTVVHDPKQPIPPRTIPVLKLLGSAFRDDFVLSSNDYRVRQPTWYRFLRDFSNIIQGSPVLCLGMEETPWVLLDLLAIMLSDVQLVPGPVLLLEDDPILRNGYLNDLANRGLQVVRVRVSLSAFIKAQESIASQAYTPKLPFQQQDGSAIERLGGFGDLATIVNLHTSSGIGNQETHLLRDLLFSPTTPQWDAFVHKLDFPRTIMPNFLKAVQACLKDMDSVINIVAYGASATGKTTILKRLALELAQSDHLVLWIRPYFFQNGPSEVRRLFRQIAETKAHLDKRIFVFVDNPIGLGSLKLADISEGIETSQLEAVVITGARSAEMYTDDSELALVRDIPCESIEIPDKFDDAEWAALPAYLVKLGIYPDVATAKLQTSNASSSTTRDVLGMLFWLLPETRQGIIQSVRDEHLRLGDRAAFSEVLIGELNRTSALLKDAYELVAAASRYGTPVPMEVLVSALQVGYTEWLDAANPDGLLWGLLYQEASEDDQTTLYRTRNDVVTDVIIQNINGGTMSRAGELSRLKKLLRACASSSPVYREFCIRLLVPNDRRMIERLEYEEGMELFEEAVNALPYDDRTLLHHMGRWEKNKGGNTAKARQLLQRALKAPLFPHSSRGEAPEHIYTTLAANEIDAIRAGEVTPEEGKQNALAHLERARSAQFINANAVHAQATLITTLAELTGKPSDPDTLGMIDNALGDVDRTLLLIKSQFKTDAKRSKSIGLLEEARANIFDRCVPLHEVTDEAEKMWSQYRRQDGFILIARKLYGAAVSTNKGTDFNAAYQYCLSIKEKVTAAGDNMSPQLMEVLLHIYFRWHVRRYIYSESHEPIDWKLVEALAGSIVASNRSRNDPFYMYVLALAKSHLRDWPAAETIFDELRRRGLPQEVLYEPRDFLMNEKGGMLRVQGLVKSGAGFGKRFFSVESLKQDFPIDRFEKMGRDGETEYGYIRFRFAGPIAVKEP